MLKPEDGAPSFTVTLAAGTYAVQWYDINNRATEQAEQLTVTGDRVVELVSLWTAGTSAVLWLSSVHRHDTG